MKNIVMNTSGGMLTVNLNSTDERGRRNALILKDRERSRSLTDGEMQSREVVKLLANNDLCDVSRLEASRKPAGGRLKPSPALDAPAAPEPTPAAPASPRSGRNRSRTPASEEAGGESPASES